MPALLIAALLLPLAAYSADNNQNNGGNGQGGSGGGQQMHQVGNPNAKGPPPDYGNGRGGGGSQGGGGSRYGDVAHPDGNAGGNQNKNVDDGQKYPGVWSGLNGTKSNANNAVESPFGRGGEAAEAAPDIPEKPAGPVTTQDARDNFPTLIENYLADGAGKKLRLKLLSLDPHSVVPGGRSLYTAKATLKSAGIKDPVTLYFTGDFSGPEWKVIAHSFTPPSKTASAQRPAKKKRKKRR